MVKNLPGMKEARVRSLGWEEFPGGGHGNPLQYSCLENTADRGDWWAACSPWSPKEGGMSCQLDMTEVTEHIHAHIDIRLAKLQLMDNIKSCQVCVEDDELINNAGGSVNWYMFYREIS